MFRFNEVGEKVHRHNPFALGQGQDLQSQRAALNALPRERVHAVVELDPSTDSTAQETVIRRFVSQSLEPLWPGSFTPSPPTPRRWSSALLLPETAAEARPSDELLSESLGESVATRHGTTDTGSVGKVRLWAVRVFNISLVTARYISSQTGVGECAAPIDQWH